MKRNILSVILFVAVSVVSAHSIFAKEGTDNPVSSFVSKYSDAEGLRVSSLGKSLMPLMQGLSSFLGEITGEVQELPDVTEADRMMIMDYSSCDPSVMAAFVSDLNVILENGELILGTGKAFGKTGVWSIKGEGEKEGTVIVHYPEMSRVIIFLGDDKKPSAAADDPDRLF